MEKLQLNDASLVGNRNFPGFGFWNSVWFLGNGYIGDYPRAIGAGSFDMILITTRAFSAKSSKALMTDNTDQY